MVYHKFSDGVQVVRCVLDFFKVSCADSPLGLSDCKVLQSVADVELSYSQSIGRLVRSSAYTFHSNILMQWLGSEPYEEIGWVTYTAGLKPGSQYDSVQNALAMFY